MRLASVMLIGARKGCGARTWIARELTRSRFSDRARASSASRKEMCSFNEETIARWVESEITSRPVLVGEWEAPAGKSEDALRQRGAFTTCELCHIDLLPASADHAATRERGAHATTVLNGGRRLTNHATTRRLSTVLGRHGLTTTHPATANRATVLRGDSTTHSTDGRSAIPAANDAATARRHAARATAHRLTAARVLSNAARRSALTVPARVTHRRVPSPRAP